MWKTIKSVFASNDASSEQKSSGPLGLVVGGSWEVDLFDIRLKADEFQFEPGDGKSVIVAKGEADLGDGVMLYRFYDSNDQVLQVLAGADDAEDIREVTLFQPFDTIQPGSPGEWQQWTGTEGWMRQVDYELDDGTCYQRAWFADTTGPAELVEFTELIGKSDDASQRSLKQACMLYSRRIAESQVSEHLLVIKESLEGGDVVELMVGVDIKDSQLKVF